MLTSKVGYTLEQRSKYYPSVPLCKTYKKALQGKDRGCALLTNSQEWKMKYFSPQLCDKVTQSSQYRLTDGSKIIIICQFFLPLEVFVNVVEKKSVSFRYN